MTDLKTITVYSFKTVEVEDYDRNTLTEKQKARQLIAMGYDVDDPDIETKAIKLDKVGKDE